mmetsp:Transcript_148155/g.283920  ORF Transcript_148155/g.283920 Transcript_148155/m.283920 type:complete len:517 (-) Transcript_148155:38-1588(-)
MDNLLAQFMQSQVGSMGQPLLQPTPSGLDSHEIHKMTLKAQQRRRPMKDLAGIMFVRVVGGEDLAIGDFNVLTGSGSSDPYAVITVTDDNGHVSKRRTSTVFKTIEPTWREEFKFGVAKERAGLTLQCEVFDEDEGCPKDDFLGQAEVDLQPYVNGQKEPRTWHPIIVSLKNEENDEIQHRGSIVDMALLAKEVTIQASGQVTLKVRWEPLAGNCYRVLKAVFDSSKALSTLGSILVGTAAYLLLVASRARWLCRGPGFAECIIKEVYGVTTCCVIASLVAFVATGIQLVGAFGFLGKAWNCAPPHMLDLLEDPDEDQYLHLGDEDMGLDVDLKIKSGSVMASLHVPHVSGDYFRKPLFSLRLIAWCMKLLALVFTGLSLYFALIPRGTDLFLAEGFFLAVAAESNILLGGLMLGRAGMLHASLLESEWKVFQKTKLGRYNDKDLDLDVSPVAQNGVDAEATADFRTSGFRRGLEQSSSLSQVSASCVMEVPQARRENYFCCLESPSNALVHRALV